MNSAPASPVVARVPLCVDLDGTLIRTDLLLESLLALAKQQPLALLLMPLWLLGGKARLKREVAARVNLDVALLPYHEEFVAYLREEHRAGRELILATASHVKYARQVADHVGLFSGVIATDDGANIRGSNKLAAIREKLGAQPFAYAGNSSVDLPIWEHSASAIVVDAPKTVSAGAAKRTKVGAEFQGKARTASTWLRALRVHQWAKNLIVFVPAITSHRIGEPATLLNSAFAFLAFCLCASSVYLLNDLLDLEADRHHSRKRLRPFASGELPIQAGFALAPLLFAAGFAVASVLPPAFLGTLAVYYLATLAYSLYLKQKVLVDVIVLAGLYTIRLIGGHTATDIVYSTWLLVFAMFIFISLALVKRCSELHRLQRENKEDARGRGYVTDDLVPVTAIGATSGCLSVLVLALYITSTEVTRLYAQPRLLLLACPLFLYWIGRMWIIANRGRMHDDPIVFALKDRISYAVAALTFGVMMLASLRGM